MNDDDVRLMRVPEAAAYLSLSRSHAYDLVRSGEMPGVVRVGQAIRIDRKALDTWLDEQVRPTGLYTLHLSPDLAIKPVLET